MNTMYANVLLNVRKGAIMDIKQMLPLLLGRLGEKEQALLKATQTHDPAAIGTLLTKLQQEKAPNPDVYACFKRIIPAETLGAIIKYFDGQKQP